MSTWRKSTRSAGATASVELRSTPAGFQVRDSKPDERSPIFDPTGGDLDGLLRTAKEVVLAVRRLNGFRHQRQEHRCGPG